MVDDRPSNLTALEAVLQPLGAELVKATSGEEALWRLLEHEFALVLLDVQMPGLDGFRVAQLIRERPSTQSLPIIFLTALSREPDHIFRGYEHGAVDYLVKPFDANVLRSKVAVFVDLYRKSKLVEIQAELIRKKEREELQLASEERFRRLTEAVPVCLWAIRNDGTAYYSNRKAGSCFSPSTPEPSHFLDAVHPEDRAMVDAGWKQARSYLEPFQLECRLRNRTDTWRWFSLHGVPTYDASGVSVGWIVSGSDIDRSRRAEESLLQKESELQVANAAKDAFMAAASHELRSPLTAAKLALRKVNKGGPTSVTPKTVELVARQVDRMAKLVDDLFDVSRLQHGRLALELSKFDLASLAKEVHERVSGCSERHVFRCEVPSGLELYADRGRLDQVLTNLLANAVRYSPEGGEVVIGAEPTGENVHLYVKDQGVGIPKEKHKVIFERFGQAHGARYGGLGLGLTIVEGIVLQHQGRIWVESDGQPGLGSTFHVQLPRAAAAKAEVQQPQLSLVAAS
ncbi:MAG: response regulator [Archangiaceae bacterium]|nr:response regulator [Archangiaceae bacterium]